MAAALMWVGALIVGVVVGLVAFVVGVRLTALAGPLLSTLVLSWILGTAVFLWGVERSS